MELTEFELWEIESYFRLDERIQRVEDDTNRLIRAFYNQTLSSHVEWNGYEGSRTVGFRVESKVIAFVDTVEKMNKRIDRLSKKKRYFTNYLDSLSPEEREYLVSKYTNESSVKDVQQEDLNLLDEIHEIEIAICYMYGFPIEEASVIINNDFLDDDFSKMADLLGV